MRKSKLFAFLCAVGTCLSTFGEALSVGDVIAVDVGATIGSAANFNTFLGAVDGTVPAETINSVVKWNDGITVADNVSVTLSSVRGFGVGAGATSWVGIEDDIYLDANAMDQAYSDSSISLTFSGLDNSLRYNVRGYIILNDENSGVVTVTDGAGTQSSPSVLRSAMYAETTLEATGTVFSGLQTDGSGNIVVTASSSQWAVLTAVVLEAVAVPPMEAPVATVTDLDASGFTANWSATAGATSYTVVVATNSDLTTGVVLDYTTVDGSEVSKAVTGLTAETTYYYGVKSNYSGCSSEYSVGNVTTPKFRVMFDDFESGYTNWTVEGEAFGTEPSSGGWGGQNINNESSFVNTYYGHGDQAIGRLKSENFTLEYGFINFKIAGGSKPNELCLNLVVDGEVVKSASGNNNSTFIMSSWNVTEWMTKSAYFEILDQNSGGWGHILLDDISFSNEPLQERKLFELSMPSYYEWKYREKMAEFAASDSQVQADSTILLGDSVTQSFPTHWAPAEWKLVNRGISGDCIGGWKYLGLFDRLDECVYQHQPKRVYIAIGINDVIKWHSTSVSAPLTEKVNGYRAIITGIQENSPNTKIYIQTILPVRTPYEQYNAEVVEINAEIESLANELNVTFVDTHSSFLDSEGQLDSSLTTDGVHLTTSGYDIWFEKLEELFNETPDSEEQALLDKGFDSTWINQLTERGVPEVWTGNSLSYIGMPIGGLFCGQVYLGGDGRLWYWDIHNIQSINPGGPGDKYYLSPMNPDDHQRVSQQFYLKVGENVKALNSNGFSDIAFRGEYPLGKVAYKDATIPIDVDLTAYSPFCPTDSEDSGLPLIIMEYKVSNPSGESQTVSLGGTLQNSVGLFSNSQDIQADVRNRIINETGRTSLVCDGIEIQPPANPNPQPDIIFDDFESGNYNKWTVEGDAFGNAPFVRTDFASYHNVTGHQGTVLVNSHNTRITEDVIAADALTGKLTSEIFTIDRDYITMLVSGGEHVGQTCVNLLVNGQNVASIVGNSSNAMVSKTIDTTAYIGQSAQLEIVDSYTGGWGQIGVDYIVFTDAPQGSGDLMKLPDYGSMQLTVFEDGYGNSNSSNCFVSGDAESTSSIGSNLSGAVSYDFTLNPGEEKTVTFAISWNFPNIHKGYNNLRSLTDIDNQRNYYYKRFKTASEVMTYWDTNQTSLRDKTFSWHDTWYDSTLPWWFLDRTFINVSSLATTVWHRFHDVTDSYLDGRPYCWEGVYLGDGTCNHVLHYEQAMGKVFPGVSRDLREIVDYGLAFDSSGYIRYRGEFGYGQHTGIPYAVDGQCGTILRMYREHQMSPDNAFLQRNWDKVKKSIEYLINQDKEKDGTSDGILEGTQYNTLDRIWYGKIPWISGLYNAVLNAGAEMAETMGDTTFANTCRQTAALGKTNLKALYNSDYGYFIQELDQAHLTAPNSNIGCMSDQLLGEYWGRQNNIQSVFPEAESLTALTSIFNHNFMKDVGTYQQNAEIQAHRSYSRPGESGINMCTFPHGDGNPVSENTVIGGYFSETWTGQEHALAALMIDKGMVTQGMALVKAVHERYAPEKRNPYNEVEYGNHYSRAMSGFAPFVSAAGYHFDGPAKKISFAPKLNRDNFKSAFIAAEGWGSFNQTISGDTIAANISLKYGDMTIKEIGIDTEDKRIDNATVLLNGQEQSATISGDSIIISSDIVMTSSDQLEITVQTVGPSAPSTVAATNVSESGFTANWNAVENTDSYTLTVDDDTDFSSPLLTQSGITATNYAVAMALVSGTPVYYKVMAVNASGTSPDSNTTTVTLTLPPTILADKAVTSEADGQIAVSDVVLGEITEATLMTWFKPASNADTIFALRDSTGTKASLHWWSAGTKILYFTDGGSSQWDSKNLSVQIPQDKWSHIALVLADSPGRTTEGVAKLYVNGTLATTFNYGLNSSSSSTTFAIGGNGNSGDLGYATYDETTVWNVQLTQEQIQSYMHKPPALDATGLLLYWNFDGSNLNDKTSNGFNGTASGTSSFVDSGAMINTDADYATEGYLWNASLSGIDASGVSITTATSITAENSGLFYGLKTSADVDGHTSADLGAVDSVSRLERVWQVDELSVQVKGDISFDKSVVGIVDGDASTYRLLYRNNLTRATEFSDTGVTAKVEGEMITFSGVEFDSGEYTLGSILPTVPTIGMTVAQIGNILVWTVELELGIKEYLVVDTDTGIVLEVILPLGETYSYELPEGVNGSITVVGLNAFQQSFIPADGNVVKVVYDLKDGWNLISMPGDNADISKLKNATTGNFWGWNGTAYETVEIPTVGNAIWVYVPNNIQVIVAADKVETELTLEPGWNMVGPTVNMEVPDKAHTVYGWNETYQQIANDNAVLIQGIGYWIFSL